MSRLRRQTWQSKLPAHLSVTTGVDMLNAESYVDYDFDFDYSFEFVDNICRQYRLVKIHNTGTERDKYRAVIEMAVLSFLLPFMIANDDTLFPLMHC